MLGSLSSLWKATHGLTPSVMSTDHAKTLLLFLCSFTRLRFYFSFKSMQIFFIYIGHLPICTSSNLSNMRGPFTLQFFSKWISSSKLVSRGSLIPKSLQGCVFIFHLDWCKYLWFPLVAFQLALSPIYLAWEV